MFGHQLFRNGQPDAAKTTGDQIGALVAQDDALGFGQRHGPQAQRKAFAVADRKGSGDGRSQQILEHLARQHRWNIARFALRQRQIKHRNGRIRKFMRDYPSRADDGGLVRIAQLFGPDLRRVRGEDGHMDRPDRFGGQRLRQKQQAPEPLFLGPVEKAAAGAVGFRLGDQPAMHDPAGQLTRAGQIADQQIVTVAAPFGRDDVAGVGAGECIAGADGVNLMPCLAQAGGQGGKQSCVVLEYQPGLFFGIGQIAADIDITSGILRGPDGFVTPVGQVFRPGQPIIGRGLHGAGLDEIG